jgi:hypothetical protein
MEPDDQLEYSPVTCAQRLPSGDPQHEQTRRSNSDPVRCEAVRCTAADSCNRLAPLE